MSKKIACFCIVLTLISAVFSTFTYAQGNPVTAKENTNTQTTEQQIEEKPSIAVKILDIVFVRPLSIPVAAASTTIGIVTAPLTYAIGIGDESANVLIRAPWRFVGSRHLGEFNHYQDEKPVIVLSQ